MEQRTQTAVPRDQAEAVRPLGRPPPRARKWRLASWAGLLALAYVAGTQLTAQVRPLAEFVHSGDAYRFTDPADWTPAEPVAEAAPVEAPEEIDLTVEDPETVAGDVLHAGAFAAPTLVSQQLEAKRDAAEELQRETEARATAKRVRSESANDAAAVKRLMAENEVRAAQILALQCVASNSATAECHNVLGAIYLMRGEPERARAEYGQFLKYAASTHPDYDSAQEIVDHLDLKR